MGQKVFRRQTAGSLSRLVNLTNRPQDADGLITGWLSPSLNDELISSCRNLKIIAHTAGSIKDMIPASVWARKIKVVTAASALAVGVAEYAFALMVTMGKKVYWAREETRLGRWREKINEHIDGMAPLELYTTVVGIVGASRAGRNVIKLLKLASSNVVVYDPCLSEQEAAALAVKKVELDELMNTADIVSLHAPSIPETNHMINAANLKLMKDGAIFINTARGQLVDEDALISELKTGRIFAAIDVTDPEPPARDSELRTLPNVVLTPHVAGAVGSNTYRQGDLILQEIKRFSAGKPLQHEVTQDMLATEA